MADESAGDNRKRSENISLAEGELVRELVLNRIADYLTRIL